ncbi:hypothetical protein EV426DRAFT_226528 [Tirmania nivea]|nr:hypothetical protein EV426DRAFT_226528 [Tirmania nivea]
MAFLTEKLSPQPESSNSDVNQPNVPVLESLAGPLIQRCSVLLEEVQTLQKFIKENHLPETELRAFRSHVQSELRFLKNIGYRSDAGAEEERTQHSLRSSNLGYFELVWAAAKSSTGLCSILTHVHETGLRPSVKQEKAVKSVQVEVIAQDGLQWIKLNAISPKRLMYELAKSGYEGFPSLPPSSDSDSELTAAEADDEDDDDDDWNRTAISSIPLIRHADLLSRAAKNTWVNYRHPHITYLFQNVHLHNSPAPIKAIIRRLQQTGATVHCADEPPSSSTSNHGLITALHNPLSLKDTLRKLKERDLYAHISHKLNIDCTILLALASDISNTTVAPTSRKFNHAILSQLKNETHRPLLPSILFPMLAGHELYCTRTARRRFEQIVDEIGTLTEKVRAEFILGTITTTTNSSPISSSLWEGFQSNCIHPVPKDLKFPIQTLEEEFFEGPFPQAEGVSRQLTPINQSVIMTGWRMGMTTITSNVAVGKVVDGKWTKCLEEMERKGVGLEALDGVCGKGENRGRGPNMWMLFTARSLVGKGPRPKSVDETDTPGQEERDGGGEGEEGEQIQLVKQLGDVCLDEGGVRI